MLFVSLVGEFNGLSCFADVCADALVFLENVGLAEVREVPLRTVHISSAGRDFIGKLSRNTDEIGVLVRQLQRDHHAVEQGGLELL